MKVSDLPLAEQMFLGLDLGVQQDFTALVFVEYHPRYLVKRALKELEYEEGLPEDEEDELLFPEYRVRVLPRWPLGTPLPQIAKGLRRMLRSPGLRDRDVSLAVDTTGPGEGARDTLERFGLYAKNVIITGGVANDRGVSPALAGRIGQRLGVAYHLPGLRWPRQESYCPRAWSVEACEAHSHSRPSPIP